MRAADPEAEAWDVRVVHPPSPIAERSAQLLESELSTREPPGLAVTVEEDERLTARVAGNRHQIDEDLQTMQEVTQGTDSGHVVVVVGHEPAMSWLLHHLVEPHARSRFVSFVTALRATTSERHARRWLHAPQGLPLRRGELVMLRSDCSEWRPVWALSPGSTQLIAHLRDKIASKMESAKQLGAFVTALLTFAVGGVLESGPGWPRMVAWTGVGLLAAAVVAFFATLFRYDSLLMPTTMWASTKPATERQSPLGILARPPSSAAWILFHNMQLVWLRGFTVACALTAAGGMLVVIGLARPQSPAGWLLVASLLVAIAALGSLVWSKTRPVLGVND
jgi:hypothetical protein